VYDGLYPGPFDPYPTLVSSGVVDGYAIQVRWKSGDGIADQTSSPIIIPTSNSTSNDNNSNNIDHQGLSRSAIIAISITIPVISLSLLILAVFCFLRRKKRRKQANLNHVNSSDQRELAMGDKKMLGSPKRSRDLSNLPASSGKTDWGPEVLGQSPTLSSGTTEHTAAPSKMPVTGIRRVIEQGIETVHELAHPAGRFQGAHIPEHQVSTSDQESYDPRATASGAWKEVSRDSEGLIAVEEAPAQTHQETERNNLRSELERVREEQEKLRLEQLGRRERELEERLRALDSN
jgi:hypothetical protein